MKTSKELPLLVKKLFKNKTNYIVFFILFVSGVILGTISSALYKDFTNIYSYLNNFLSAYSLQGIAYKHIYYISLINYCKMTFIMWISGWHILLYPLGIIQIIAKGYQIGFTISSILNCFGFKGLLLVLFSVVLPNMLLIFGLCLFWIYQTYFLLNIRYVRNLNSTNKKTIYVQNLIVLVMFFLIMNICSLIDGFVVPGILKHIISLLFT